MATVKEYMVQTAKTIAADNRYGYWNKPPNNTFGMLPGDTMPYDGDCGGFVSYCLNQALKASGINSNEYFEPMGQQGATFTTLYNEEFLLKYCDRYNYSSIKNSLEAGDILVASGHTAMVTAKNGTQITHAGGDRDGRSGDSSGQEICTTGWFDAAGPGGWLKVYRLKTKYGGKATSGKFKGNTRTKTFKKRTTAPTSYSPFYNTAGGTINKKYYNTCSPAATFSTLLDPNNNTLANCVGYAQGRALEIYCELEGYDPAKTGTHPFTTLNGNPDSWIGNAKAAGLKISQTPQPGAVLVLTGHVAVVEEVSEDGKSIKTSESGCPSGWDHKMVAYNTRTKAANWSDYNEGGFLGFILNPAEGIGSDSGSSTKSVREVKPVHTRVPTDEEIKTISKKTAGYDIVFEEEDITVTKTFEGLVTATGDFSRAQGTQLLSFPTLVESPFVLLRVGDYTFGTYSKSGNLQSKLNVQYPNFIQGMTVQKVNGTVNQYTINLVYQIEAGRDPNLVDRILSTVGYDLVYISYGDWMCPNFIYKEEEALITNVKSNVEFSNSRINYTISCTSNSIALAANTFNFPMRKAKPSDIIWDMLYNNQYGLLDLFSGMINKTSTRQKGLIATNDQVVEIPSKEGISPLMYLNYLVSCMASSTSEDNILRDSSYYLTIHDDKGAPYFKITEVKAQTKTLAANDTYEVDVGFPTDNLVTEFNIKDDNSWALLYKYASEIDNQKYVYSIDGQGNIVTKYSPNITTSTTGFTTTEAQKTWWTQMTQFPITANLKIKGLLRPSMLMSYVRINAFFYGQRHISSGLYIITKQVDTINNGGYKTELTLTRIGGDYDYISTVTKTVTTQKPKITLKKNENSLYNYVKENNIVESIRQQIEKLNEAQGLNEE